MSVPQRVALDAPIIHRLQLRHFLMMDAVPLLIVLAVPLYSRFLIVGTFEIGLLFAFWFITGIGITVGYHRLFTHRSFQCPPWMQVVLAICASMAGQGGVISWVAIHRLHHEKSDLEGDPHSPNRHGSGFWKRTQGLLHSHLLWMARHSYPNTVRYAPDLLRDRRMMWVNRYYLFWVALGLAIPALLGAAYHRSWQGAMSGLFWGGILRMLVLEHIIWSINSFLHTFGSRAYDTREGSRNFAPASLITLGECWHNNHHRFPHSPNFGLRWYNLDPGYWFIATMRRLGLAWNLKLPDRALIASRRAAKLNDASS